MTRTDALGVARDLIVGLLGGGLTILLGRVTLPVAAVMAILLVAVLRQRNANEQLKETVKMLSSVTLNAEDVLGEAADADRLAAAAEDALRAAAERRKAENDGGGYDAMTMGTYSGTLEHAAREHLQEWDRRFSTLMIKLDALGFRAFVPSEPRHKIAGEPSAAAIKLICEREALDVAADALRMANASTVSGARPTTRAAQNN